MNANLLDVRPNIAAALAAGRAVVALESTVIAHGLPWPRNVETARATEAAVRAEGAVPATIAVLGGRPTVGLDDAELESLARAPGVAKASRRDLAAAVALGKTAATTVAATMTLAQLAGIRVFATGGIGGVHPGPRLDVSSDLVELARTSVAVVCAGAKSILDLARTLEVLETLGVPVVGVGTDRFPAFYVRASDHPVSATVDSPAMAAQLLRAHWRLGGAGVVLALPIADEVALDLDELNAALAEAERQAEQATVRGPTLTPFLLARLAEITEGRTLRANRSLLVANARFAARVAVELAGTTAD
jgi:pseudouridine-5'-phosphate glycosidase